MSDHLPGSVHRADLSQPNVNNFREVAPRKGRGCKPMKKDGRFIALEYLCLLKMKWHIRAKEGAWLKGPISRHDQFNVHYPVQKLGSVQASLQRKERIGVFSNRQAKAPQDFSDPFFKSLTPNDFLSQRQCLPGSLGGAIPPASLSKQARFSFEVSRDLEENSVCH